MRLCRTFKDIAKIEGNKSQDQKKGLIVKLLGASGKSGEAGFIIRLLQVVPCFRDFSPARRLGLIQQPI